MIKERVRAEKRRNWLLEKLPGWQAEITAIESKIRRLDPEPPTRDLAAYMGVGSAAARRYRSRYTPARIHDLAVLWGRHRELSGYIAAALEIAD